AHLVIENRIKLFVVLPIEEFDGIAIKRSVDDIGRRGAAPRLEFVMTSVTEISRRRAAPALGTFERYLILWVALCIIAGIVLGRLVPGPFQALGRMTVAEVNIPVAVLIWLMIVPMLIKVDFGALHRVAEQWRGIAVTV